ncbi:hypothetical protein [Olleya sp. ITB9]|uniref:hypothetical protein n=1 Tax=Olleya sp. ITB9 TaxID=1715648 RepID=UPI0006CF434F|nr:hypothetical protein [Olleya sp. ITB9]
MKKISLILIVLISNLSYSQDSLFIKIKNEKNKILDNVLVLNKHNNKYSYSNENGISKIIYKNNSDSIEFSIPGFKNNKLTIKEIYNKNKEVILNEEIEILDEVIISSKKIPEHDYNYKIKSKKKYYTTLVSSEATILSSYTHKNCNDCELVGIVFYLENDVLFDNETILIRPLIFNNKEGKRIDILKSPQVLEINNNTSKLIIDLSNSNINFQKKEMYYIGFELINKNGMLKRIKIKSSNEKRSHALMKSKPTSEWFKQDNNGNGFSNDFELYFRNK